MLKRTYLVRAGLAMAASIAMSAVALSPAFGVGITSSTQSTGQSSTGGFLSGDSKTNCAYPANSLAELSALSTLTGATYNCVLLFNDAKPTWADWTNVWWAGATSPDSDFFSWLRAEPGRRVIISQPMVPEDAPSDWSALGAEGDYNSYATQLASNLVAEGMGNSIIRLGWEANCNCAFDNALGSTPAEYSDWVTYWRNIVQSMRAVPGANFQFDWTINQYWEPLPLQDWYPGDDVVDVIGIDAYDSGITTPNLTPAQRWAQLYNETDGLAAIAAFAAEHNKPLSIPEWGLETPAITGAGDDPTYIQGLGSFIADNNVEYNSYFFGGPGSDMVYLPDAPESVAAYNEYFPGVTGPDGLVSSTTTSTPSVGSTSTSAGTAPPTGSNLSSSTTTSASSSTTVPPPSSTSTTGPLGWPSGVGGTPPPPSNPPPTTSLSGSRKPTSTTTTTTPTSSSMGAATTSTSLYPSTSVPHVTNKTGSKPREVAKAIKDFETMFVRVLRKLGL